MEHKIKLTEKNKQLYDMVYLSYVSGEPIPKTRDIVMQFCLSREDSGNFLAYTTKRIGSA